MLRNGVTAGAIGALVLLLPTGCAATGPSTDPSPALDTVGYTCDGRSVPRDARDERVPISDLGEEAHAALTEAVQSDGMELDLSPAAGWFVVNESGNRIDIMRGIEASVEPYPGEDLPDHEILGVERARIAEGALGWHVWTHDVCALRLDLDPLVVPSVTLESEADPGSTELHLLVTENQCNSGKDAEGRIEVVHLEESDDRVSIVLGVRPRDENATCQGNPSTPFTVTLTDPLGDRKVFDAGLADPRPLTVG